MSRILILLGTLLFSASLPTIADSGHPISGAFGQKLGATFKEPLNVVAELKSGAVLYGFQPSKPSPMFKQYAVVLTPASRRIAEIIAWTRFKMEESAKCAAELKVVEAVLDTKYESLKVENDFSITDSVIYRSGVRRIYVQCDWNDNLMLSYEDETVGELAIKERASEIDNSEF